jgi:hypothetical protein
MKQQVICFLILIFVSCSTRENVQDPFIEKQDLFTVCDDGYHT